MNRKVERKSGRVLRVTKPKVNGNKLTVEEKLELFNKKGTLLTKSVEVEIDNIIYNVNITADYQKGDPIIAYVRTDFNGNTSLITMFPDQKKYNLECLEEKWLTKKTNKLQ